MRTRIRRGSSAERARRRGGGHGGVAGDVQRALAGVAGGRLQALPVTVRFWDGSTLPAAATGADGNAPVVVVRDRAVLAHLVREPNQVGLARAWADGGLDVEGTLEPVLALRDRLSDIHLAPHDRARLRLQAARIAGPRILRRPPVPAIESRTPRARRHSQARDRVAVTHHYDVSNRFYRMVLGPSMVYSSAVFASPRESLEEAQRRKLELICRKLRLAPGERFLDIGCGWGSLLLHAAGHHGVRAVGVTLSAPQAELARRRIREAGLAGRAEVRVADYRVIADGPFDKIASIGMYEHVGRSELPNYARTVAELLRPGGLFLNSGITRLASEPPASETFISRYIFPDGELHPVTDIMVAMQQAGLEVRDVESLREHYALTLRRWLANLESNRPDAVAEVGPARERVWKLYMLGSAQAFEAGEISVYQVLAARAGAPHGLPLDRAELLRPPHVHAARTEAAA